MYKGSYSIRLGKLRVDSYFKSVSLPTTHRVLAQFGRYALIIPMFSQDIKEAFLLHSSTPAYMVDPDELPYIFPDTLNSDDLT